MRLKDIADGKTSDVFNIPLDRIAVQDGFNCREESSDLAQSILDLADYILAGGWIPPLVVRQAGEQAIIVDGHRRFAATRMAVEMGASIERMACVSVPRMTNEADWTALMLSSQEGRKLSPQEQIEPIKRLMRWMQDDVAAVAKKIGKSRQHVEQILELAETPPEVQAMVRDGVVSATVARLTVRAEGDGAVATLHRAAEVSKRGKATAGAIRKAREPAAINGRVAETLHPKPSPVVPDDLTLAVRRLLAVWDDPEPGSGEMCGCIARLRELVA